MFLGAQPEWLINRCLRRSGPNVVIQRQFAQMWLRIVKKKLISLLVVAFTAGMKMPAVNSVIKWLTGFKHNVIHFGLCKLLTYAVKRKSVMHLEVHRRRIHIRMKRGDSCIVLIGWGEIIRYVYNPCLCLTCAILPFLLLLKCVDISFFDQRCFHVSLAVLI